MNRHECIRLLVECATDLGREIFKNIGANRGLVVADSNFIKNNPSLSEKMLAPLNARYDFEYYESLQQKGKQNYKKNTHTTDITM